MDLRSMRRVGLFLAIAISVADCTSSGGGNGKEEDPGPETICESVVELAAKAGYILYEGTGCPVGDTIGTPEFTNIEDDGADTVTLGFDFPFMGTGYGQVTVNTNGTIWMAADTRITDYELLLLNGDWADETGSSTGSGIPFIAAWNLDLDVYYCEPSSNNTCDAVRGQLFSDPNRLLVDWDTEAYDEGDTDTINHFQAYLFETGEILFFYDDMNTVDPDSECPGATYCGYEGDWGSGITLADGNEENVFSLTETLGGPVWMEEGNAFLFSPAPE